MSEIIEMLTAMADEGEMDIRKLEEEAAWRTRNEVQAASPRERPGLSHV